MKEAGVFVAGTQCESIAPATPDMVKQLSASQVSTH